jgi:thiol-disulfide isomerase/thioredoxin
MTDSVIEIHDVKSFLDVVSTGFTVIDFTATWCGPCKRIAPMFSDLARQYTQVIPNLKFVKVDVDEVQEAAQGISGMPTFQFWVEGQRIDSLTTMGANIARVKQNVDDLLVGNYALPAIDKVSTPKTVEKLEASSGVTERT